MPTGRPKSPRSPGFRRSPLSHDRPGQELRDRRPVPARFTPMGPANRQEQREVRHGLHGKSRLGRMPGTSLRSAIRHEKRVPSSFLEPLIFRRRGRRESPRGLLNVILEGRQIDNHANWLIKLDLFLAKPILYTLWRTVREARNVLDSAWRRERSTHSGHAAVRPPGSMAKTQPEQAVVPSTHPYHGASPGPPRHSPLPMHSRFWRREGSSWRRH